MKIENSRKVDFLLVLNTESRDKQAVRPGSSPGLAAIW